MCSENIESVPSFGGGGALYGFQKPTPHEGTLSIYIYIYIR